ncbi:MAG: DapH/DapD/GlmU-related protein [Desulfovibrio sp.]|uniref:DapH/DapD/GlmU-related protein n=1 Tax=Desulfovibrio sp. TaxID=885 RepID=UPI002A366C23|nr:DapH/DapD/GlmU-related protein [Desulfovibrio sp.]MDY0259441.1 DapH/DapD/GlmU-related protein [Desulfovibrio sp.]
MNDAFSSSVAMTASCATPRVAQGAILTETTLGRWTDVGPRCLMHGVTMGDYSYVCNDADLMYANVGKFVSIASHVRINPSNHPWWRPTLHHFTYRPGRYGLAAANETDVDEDIFAWRRQYTVRIGHDVWIGHGAVLLPGVSVGNGAIVGAGSIVTKDVPAWHIVVGNPGAVLRPRFADPGVAERLERLAWWNWPEETLRRNWKLFQLPAEQFLLVAEGLAAI